MDTNGRMRRAVTLALVLVAAAGGPPSRAVAARSGRRFARSRDGSADSLSACTGTYVVKGKPLIGGGKAGGGDAVVLEVAGPVEGTPPLVTVHSGCATAPATLTAKRGGTVVTADLSQCGAVRGTAHLRALIDGDCRRMKGRLRGCGA